jgi:hypothetical protein
MSGKVSIVTILHGETEFIPMILHNYQGFLKTQDLELVIVDDGPQSLASHFTEVPECVYLHLSESEISGFFETILEGYKQPNKTPLLYQRKLQTLPQGFKRDYGCGVSSHPIIFHMNADCIYNPKAIDRKCRYLKRLGAECTYCDTMLCYDIYNQGLYKTESPYKIYEATLCHTREFWKRRGFQWSDIEMEGKYFHYNNGHDRKQDNYYDTIQLLGIHNLNAFRPVQVTIDNLEIKIPDMVSEIHISTHPFVQTMRDLYGTDDLTLLGINSEFVTSLSDSEDKEENWRLFTINEKWKQKKLPNLVLGHRDTFHVLMYGSKHPTWTLFERVPFDLIFLETRKNHEQMTEILTKCKKYEYINLKGVFVRKAFLETEEEVHPSEVHPSEAQDI